jgi:hypothetical protein
LKGKNSTGKKKFCGFIIKSANKKKNKEIFFCQIDLIQNTHTKILFKKTKKNKKNKNGRRFFF